MTSQPTYPDWGVRPGQLPAVDQDIAELAARNGYGSMRRGGKLLHAKVFDTSFEPYVILFGTGTEFINGYKGLYGSCADITAPIGLSVYLQGFFPLIPQSTLGVEVLYQVPSSNGRHSFVLSYAESLHRMTAYIHIDYETGQIGYTDNGLVWFDTIQNSAGWKNVKFVLDVQNSMLRSVYYNSQSWRLDIPLPQSVGWSTGITAEIRCTGGTLTAQNSHIQAVYLTTDEPE